MNKTLLVASFAVLGLLLLARKATAATVRPRPLPPIIIITPDQNPQPIQSGM